MQPLGSDTRHFPLLARVSLALRPALILILPMPKIVCFHEVGDASVLKLEELPKPEPKEGQVLDEIVEAHRYMESNEQIGKIAVSV